MFCTEVCMFQNDIITISPACREIHVLLENSGLPFLDDLGMTAAGHGIQNGKYEIRRQPRKGHQLLYTLSGQGWFRQNGSDSEAMPGTLFLCPHGETQHYGLMEGSAWEILWFVFDPASAWWREGPEDRVAGLYPAEWGSFLRASVLGLHRELRSSDPGSAELTAAFIRQIRIYLERELHPLATPDLKSLQQSRLFLLREKIEADLAASWTVDRLARASGLNVCGDHFARICKEILGQTPIQWVTDLRMQKAKELLCASDYKLELLAGLLGYANPFAFSVAFKRAYSISPAQYRAEGMQTKASPLVPDTVPCDD